MKEILSFIVKNQSKYLPTEFKEKIKFFQSVESSFKIIFLENTIYFEYIVLMYLFEFIKKNLENYGEIDLNSIPKGTIVEINNQTYSFDGVSNNQIVLNEIPPRKKTENYNLCKSYYSIDKAKQELIIKTGRTKKSLKDGLFYDLAQELGAAYTNKRVSKSILVVCKGKLRQWVEDQTFKIGNRTVYFSEICPSIYVSKYNDIPVDFKKNYSKITPISIFTGSIERAVDLLQFPDLVLKNIKISQILILGEKYLNEYQRPYFNSLKIVAKEKEIPVSIYANSYCMFDIGVEEIVLNDCDFLGMLPSELGSQHEIFFEKIATNDDFNKAMGKLNCFIEELKKNQSFYGLLLVTYKLRNAVLHQVHRDSNSSNYLNRLYKRFEILYDRLNFIDESIKSTLKSLINNRYVYNVSKKILNILTEDSEMILVTDIEYMESARTLLAKYDLKNSIISNVSSPDKLIYPRGKFLFLYGRPKDYFKWFNSFQGEKLICLYPKYQEDSFSKLLEFITYKVRKFDKKNKIKEILSEPPHRWNLHLSTSKSLSSSLDKIEKEVLEEEIATSSILNVNNLIYDNKNVLNKNLESTKVEIDRIILFDDDRYIFATENYECTYLDTSGKIQITKVFNLDEGDELLIITIPYSNELYYNNADDIKKLMYKPFDKMTNYEKDEIMDWEWKNELREYVKNNHFGVEDIANKFKAIGFKKSKGFFRAWIYPKYKTMLPRDEEFIRYIGIVTKNKNIENNFKSYYRASERLKGFSRDERNRVNKDVFKLGIEDAKRKFPQVNFFQEAIFKIIKVKNKVIDRNFTNRILNREDLFINGDHKE